MSHTPANPNTLAHYLQVMGITHWVRRDLPLDDVPEQELINTSTQAKDPPQHAVEAPSIIETVPPVENSSSTEPEPQLFDTVAVPPEELIRLDWQALREKVANCTTCGLHSTRKQAVFGVGAQQATWLFVGEAPGADEDAKGEPFVGRAGQLLNAMLEAIGLQREQVYIANVIKCRPPNNRNPNPMEIHCCRPFLQRQIMLLQPKIIIALGAVAAQQLLQSDKKIGQLRGQQHLYAEQKIPLIVTYHPAYLLRRPIEKRKTWQDLQMACQWLSEC